MAARIQIKVPSVALTFDKRELRKILRQAGAEVASVARGLIRRAQGTGALYSKPGGGTYRASAPGQAPVSRTGVLANSIRVKPTRSGDGVTIRDTAFYSLFLEAGAQGGGGKKGARNVRKRIGGKSVLVSVVGSRVLQPRPFLSVAADQRADSIGQRVRAAVIDGVKFQRVKA